MEWAKIFHLDIFFEKVKFQEILVPMVTVPKASFLLHVDCRHTIFEKNTPYSL
jgi:hypothetical protein